MVRKILALVTTGLILFAALLIQMTAVQAAAPRQTAPDPAIEEPLPQPLRIRINQSIPLTLNVPAALLAQSAAVTRPLTATGALTDALGAAEALTGTVALTTGADLTGSTALTDAADALGDALAGAIANATGSLTDTESLTGTEELTDTEALTATDVLTSAPLASVPVTLELSLDMVVTNTLTSTVPASITLQLAGPTTRTLPISLSVAALPDGEVFVELLPIAETVEPAEEATVEATPALTATDELTTTPAVEATEIATPTTAVTPTVEVTETVAAPSGLPVVTTTATTTANLRAGPATTFDLVGQAGAGETLPVVGVSEDGQWYLLDGGAWIATFLAADAQLANVPLATQALIDQASGVAPVPAPPIVPVAIEATPTPAATTAVSPTTTIDANLRAGPGTEFPILGGTITGQALNIVGRNADATWWRLDNTGWIFGELVINPPAAETVPVVNADGTPVEGAAAPAPTATAAAPAGGLLLPTPTPLPAGATTGSTGAATTASTTASATAATGAVDSAYTSSVQGIVTRYEDLVQTLDALIADARADQALLSDPNWANRVSAALVMLRSTGASVGELVAPAGLAAAQASLIDAASQYTAAGNALSQAASTGAVAQLDAAETAITAADTSLATVTAALAGGQ